MSSVKSDAEVEELLNHRNNSLRKTNVNVAVKIIGSGNHGNHSKDNKNRGHQDRDKDNHATIAVMAELIGGKNTSDLLGVHPSSVSKYRNGKTNSNDVDPVLIEKTEEKLGKINTKIVDKVGQLLEIFAEDKMEDLKAGEIPSSVEKLVNTYDKINRRHEKLDNSVKPQVVLYAPKQININEFITKEV
jgi:predicted transcriptional regulator